MKREHIGVALLSEHKETLKELARASGETMSVVVRRLIREEAERRGLGPSAKRPSQEEGRHE